jgi:putative component of toxin-antitoxin plasmid stabilization module
VIVGVRLSNGDCPSEAFLGSLDSPAQAQFLARFERLTEVGYLRNPEQIRALQVTGSPKVWELKVHSGPGWRLYVVQDQRTWVATHGCSKPPDRRVSNEVKRAREMFEEWTP